LKDFEKSKSQVKDQEVFKTDSTEWVEIDLHQSRKGLLLKEDASKAKVPSFQKRWVSSFDLILVCFLRFFPHSQRPVVLTLSNLPLSFSSLSSPSLS